MEQIQDLLDDVLAAFTDGDADALDARLRPGALVRTISASTGATEDEGRDDAAHARFGEAVARAAEGRGSQRRGDVHPGEPVAAMVVGFDQDGAADLDVHTLVVGIAGDQLDRVVWYRPDRG
jgi:hypothetical protein